MLHFEAEVLEKVAEQWEHGGTKLHGEIFTCQYQWPYMEGNFTPSLGLQSIALGNILLATMGWTLQEGTLGALSQSLPG